MADSLEAAGQDWLAERRAVGRTISENTAKAYRTDLAAWIRYLEAQVGNAPTLADLHPTTIKAALAEMNGAGLAPATRRRALTTLRGLCRYLVLEGRLPADPTVGIAAPRASAPLPVAFTDDQMAQLLATARTEDPEARPPVPLLDVAILLLLGGAGLRAGEATALRLRDYQNGDEPSLRVVGKGRKTRVVPLHPAVAEQLDAYLVWRADRANGDDSSPLLVRPGGKGLTRNTISYRVTRLYQRAGVPKPDGEAAHALRHTYALSMVDVGVPISEVKELLGHESIATTGIYLRASAAHLRAAAAAPSAVRMLMPGAGR
jgi:site-specific recombinase XerD